MTDRDHQQRPQDGDSSTDSDSSTGVDSRTAVDADAATDAISELGETDEERLEAVAEHNRSLEERLPGDDELPLTKG